MQKLEDQKTVGDAIRYCRLKAGFTRLEDFAMEMNLYSEEKAKKQGQEKWSKHSASQISNWEKNKTRPSVESLNLIANVCCWPLYDEIFLLGLAGYLPKTKLPPLEEIKVVLDEMCSLIEDHIYPAYITDYRLRCWAANQASSVFTHEDSKLLEDVARMGVNTFDLSFRQDLAPRHMTTNVYQTQDFQMFRFKANNLYRRHEPFYQQYSAYMQARLNPREFREFQECWNKIDPTSLKMMTLKMPVIIDARSHNIKFLSYDIGIPHLSHLFQISYYEPSSDQIDLAEKIFLDILSRKREKRCISVWRFDDPALVFQSDWDI